MDSAHNPQGSDPAESTHLAVNARLEEVNLRVVIVPQDEVNGPADNEAAARGPKTSLNPRPNLAQPASPGIPFSKTDWPKPNAPINRFSSWL
jgi:hypothetical protein